MALLESEIARIRAELGYNVMGVQAEPYMSVTAIFNTVIQQYITSGAKTTSSTPVSAASVPTAQTLSVAAADGMNVGELIVVDVGLRQEKTYIQSIVALQVTCLLSKAHSGTYPVTVEGGESIIREILAVLQDLGAGGLNGAKGAMAKMASRMGVKKVDEIEFHGGAGAMSSGKDALSQMVALREYWRDELAMTLGVERLNRRGGGGGVSSY